MGIGVQLCSLLTSVLEGSGGLVSGSGHFTHGINIGIHHRKEWLGPRSGLNGYKEEKISGQTGFRIPDLPTGSQLLHR